MGKTRLQGLSSDSCPPRLCYLSSSVGTSSMLDLCLNEHCKVQEALESVWYTCAPQDLVCTVLDCVPGNIMNNKEVPSMSTSLASSGHSIECMFSFLTCDGHRVSWDLWLLFWILMNDICYPPDFYQLCHRQKYRGALSIFLGRGILNDFFCSQGTIIEGDMSSVPAEQPGKTNCASEHVPLASSSSATSALLNIFEYLILC